MNEHKKTQTTCAYDDSRINFDSVHSASQRSSSSRESKLHEKQIIRLRKRKQKTKNTRRRENEYPCNAYSETDMKLRVACAVVSRQTIAPLDDLKNGTEPKLRMKGALTRCSAESRALIVSTARLLVPKMLFSVVRARPWKACHQTRSQRAPNETQSH